MGWGRRPSNGEPTWPYPGLDQNVYDIIREQNESHFGDCESNDDEEDENENGNLTQVLGSHPDSSHALHDLSDADDITHSDDDAPEASNDIMEQTILRARRRGRGNGYGEADQNSEGDDDLTIDDKITKGTTRPHAQESSITISPASHFDSNDLAICDRDKVPRERDLFEAGGSIWEDPEIVSESQARVAVFAAQLRESNSNAFPSEDNEAENKENMNPSFGMTAVPRWEPDSPPPSDVSGSGARYGRFAPDRRERRLHSFGALRSVPSTSRHMPTSMLSLHGGGARFYTSYGGELGDLPEETVGAAGSIRQLGFPSTISAADDVFR